MAPVSSGSARGTVQVVTPPTLQEVQVQDDKNDGGTVETKETTTTQPAQETTTTTTKPAEPAGDGNE